MVYTVDCRVYNSTSTGNLHARKVSPIFYRNPVILTQAVGLIFRGSNFAATSRVMYYNTNPSIKLTVL